MATLLVNASRGARRAGRCLADRMDRKGRVKSRWFLTEPGHSAARRT
ncbi:hypothetical protein [Streptomyces scabiei]|nr:hypothetical protein [Streptomyces scabiei]